MNLCTGCHVQPSTHMVGAYPVCPGCARDVVGQLDWLPNPFKSAVTKLPGVSSTVHTASQYGQSAVSQQRQAATTDVQSTIDTQANVAQKKLDIIEMVAIGVGA